MRRQLIVGNWKMNKTSAETTTYVRRLSDLIQPHSIDMVIAPPFTALHAAWHAMGPSSNFALAGQNVFWEDKGAYTGEISASMLKDIGCQYVIIGHSERRQWFDEQDQDINKKVKAALRHGLKPIVCVGESLADRERGETTAIVTEQLQKDLDGLSKEHMAMVAIAYEPVWAIGTGRAASPAQAVEVHTILRRTVATHWGHDTGERMRVLYGGSVNADNAGLFLESPEVDGVLVGGACLDPVCFATIARFAEDRSVPGNKRRGV
ncbi:triose-phosphate isomerase [Nitrospira sp. Nam74]